MKWVQRLTGVSLAVAWAALLPAFVFHATQNLSSFEECRRIIEEFNLELQCMGPERLDRILSSLGFGLVYFANIIGVIYIYERMGREK